MLLRRDGTMLDSIFDDGHPRKDVKQLRLRAENGDVFAGQWRNGKKSGKGTVYYADGAVY